MFPQRASLVGANKKLIGRSHKVVAARTAAAACTQRAMSHTMDRLAGQLTPTSLFGGDAPSQERVQHTCFFNRNNILIHVYSLFFLEPFFAV